MHFWFDVCKTKYIDAENECKCKSLDLGLVISQERDRYKVLTSFAEITAEISGKLEYFASTPFDYPAVGDLVAVKTCSDNSPGIIQEIMPRQNFLARKEAGSGKKPTYIASGQIIAANVGTAFIVQGLDGNFNPRRIERYLTAINNSGIRPVVLLSKSDLVEDEELFEKTDLILKAAPGIAVIPYSSLNGNGIERILNELITGETFCLIGSSGTGKSTLINVLAGEQILETACVREKDSRGRHTTSRRQMIFLKDKIALIDTPGMREFGLFDEDADLDSVFEEISELSSRCKYADCTHVHEPGCSVLQAIEEGCLDQKRYKSYLKLRKEMEYESKLKSSARNDKNEWEKRIAKLARQRRDIIY
ncbi:ribosome small subunit-dependent GTPase A [candidate division WOR-3 bacterium]|nr:ribosome small subunit-dependent GTPase A [candidate division WOR-3 bacterium]